MPYYLYQKSVATGVWECLERHHDFQAATRARNGYNQGALVRRAADGGIARLSRSRSAWVEPV